MTDWDPLLEDLRLRREAANAMGGPERLTAQRRDGRLDARARIAELVDKGSFREFGAHVGSVARGVTPGAPADGLVTGRALIAGRPALVGAEDFTVMGGSIGIGTHAKRQRLIQLAELEASPLVMLLEGTGERGQSAFEHARQTASDLDGLARLLSRVPTVSVVMGTSAGHGALTASLTDFMVMVEGAALFGAGPPVVAVATGEEVSKAALGGAAVHSVVSGVAHNVATDDRAALAVVRRYLAQFPARAGGVHPRRPSVDGLRVIPDLVDLIPADPRRDYDVRPVLERLVDDGDVLEIQPGYGRSMVTALGWLAGRSVAIVANNPAVLGGAIDVAAAEKAARFLDVVGPYELPVVFVADTPGLQVGSEAEHAGVLGSAARMYRAQAALAGPKLHVTLRRCYSPGAALMARNPFDGQTVSLAFPGARLGPLPAESGAEAASGTLDVAALLEHAELGGAIGAADQLSYDDVIDPSELRNALVGALVRRGSLGD